MALQSGSQFFYHGGCIFDSISGELRPHDSVENSVGGASSVHASSGSDVTPSATPSADQGSFLKTYPFPQGHHSNSQIAVRLNGKLRDFVH